MKSQAYHARKKAKRKARKKHLLRVDPNVNPRHHISLPKMSTQTILWEMQTHKDGIARAKEKAAIQAALLATVPSAITKPADQEVARRTGKLTQLSFALRMMKSEAVRRKNRKYMRALEDIKANLSDHKSRIEGALLA